MFVWEESRRDAARRLREEGWSLRRIAAHLDIALSSASVWTRGSATVEPVVPPQVGLPSRGRASLRWCSRCGLLRAESAFNRHPTGLQWWCRDCFKRYYAEQRPRHRARNNALKADRVQAAQALVLAHLRSTSCVDCGEDDLVVLEFDHVGAKRTDISTLVRRGVRLSTIRTEISRCEVVCANCHRRRTACRGRWRRADAALGGPWRSAAHERNVRFAIGVLTQSGCVECRVGDVVVLDFDHVGPKTGNVMRLARDEVSLGRLRDEIERCVVRCANCHRRRTAVAGRHYRARGKVPPARVELALPD